MFTNTRANAMPDPNPPGREGGAQRRVGLSLPPSPVSDAYGVSLFPFPISR